jgi:hypothetical protein
MRQRNENELLPLQEIAEQEIRKALLTAEALAALPRVTDMGMLLIFSCDINISIYFLFLIFASGHNLIRNRRKMTPPLPQSSSFLIPDSYKNGPRGMERLLLHDSNDPELKMHLPGGVPIEGRILVWSSDVQLKLLFDSPRLYMDGTFGTAPPHFEQVFIIQSILHGSCKLFLFDKIRWYYYSLHTNAILFHFDRCTCLVCAAS